MKMNNSKCHISAETIYIVQLIEEYETKDLFLVETELRSEITQDTLETTEIISFEYDLECHVLKAVEESGEIIEVNFKKGTINCIGIKSNREGE